jgi:ubiquinone/menaquinone biosynthesis C-methylase UbiE
MRQELGWQVAGVDPSSAAVEAVASMGLTAHVATADILPIPDASIDVLIYGFCLYLCDRSDLFKIAAEAHRVTRPESWLVILDFWSPHQKVNPYHHRSGVFSYKDNLSAMFSWHPSYVITDHRLRHHATRAYTDDPQEWVASTILRRCDLSSTASHG